MSDSGEYHPNETSQECNWILDLRLKFSGIGCPSAAEHSRTSSLTPDNKANKNEMEGERLAYSAVNPRETAGKHEAGMGRNTTCHGGKNITKNAKLTARSDQMFGPTGILVDLWASQT